MSPDSVASLVAKAVKLLKRVPGAWKWSRNVAKKAYSLGKTAGVAYLKRKFSEMHSWSPIKWVWKTILAFSNVPTLWAIIEWIAHHA
ncbi:hypothetical protein [Streptomyces olivochromogenes]|uniref:hypothetical protein n=1 Tax=Streptomyces olivochromogenes TaxID=1963 RepID=UPI000746E42B|nr:hypothetical protein [Streptomyces olivochromogenes]KUN39426.1 hypothetical protein AQJ27_42945 [Streptomyces olivochromogenes]